MFKKRIWKPLLIALGWTLSLAGLVVLMSFIAVKKADVVCNKIKVYIPGNHYFIDRQEVDHILQMDSRSLIGLKMELIDIHALENKLKHNPFIESAKVFMEMDGVLQVEVSQRQPVLRVMNRFDQDFYVDQHGLKMPLSLNFTARVIAANGFIDELFAGKVDSLHTILAKDVFKTADFIRKDSLWDAQIAQIYINQDHEIELIPRVGNQRILLGTADSLEMKFGNLEAFYKKAIPMVGWDAYKVINIKYSNQVIGVKNQTLMDSLNAVKEQAKRAAADSARTAAVAKSRARRDSENKPEIVENKEKAENASTSSQSAIEVKAPESKKKAVSTPSKKLVQKPVIKVKAARREQPKLSVAATEKKNKNKPRVQQAAGKPGKKAAEKKTEKKTSI